DGEEVERAVQLIHSNAGSLGQPGSVRQPTFSTGQLRARVLETVGGHREQRDLVRCGESCARGAVADRRTDTEFLPQGSGSEHDTEFENLVDVDLRDGLRA